MTACVSSQVGCSLTCKFCATGYMDRVRNLQPYEIYDQVVAIHNQAMEHFGVPLTNIVYMGMGEPLLNYANVLTSIERITSPLGLNMSPKRITLSTAGVAKMIMKLADDGVKFNLALSLHAADDEKRVSRQQEADEEAGLREHDEAHAEEREGAEGRDERVRVEPGDEGGVHRAPVVGAQTRDNTAISGQTTSQMMRVQA